MQQINFRKTALDRISTPDQLDQLIQVTSLKGWIALFGLIFMVVALLVWGIFGSVPTELNGQAVLVNDGNSAQIVAPDSGLITNLTIKSGESLTAGQVVGTLKTSSGSLENIISSSAGRVDEVLALPSDSVQSGANLANLVKPDAGSLKAQAFVDVADGKNLQPGMTVYLSPSTADAEQYGFLVGTVSYVSEYPVSAQGLRALLKNDSLAQTIASSGSMLQVGVNLNADASSFDGFKWSSSKGPNYALTSGTLCSVKFILANNSPLNLVLPVQRGGGK